VAKTSAYELGEFTFPRGWFMVADAASVAERILPVRFFGRDLALYRGKSSGAPVLLDAYCPHRGGHLACHPAAGHPGSSSRIEGDSVRCPFHGWRFGSDGVCNEIPYSSAPIPAAARVRSWKVVETLGAIFVWHDPEGGEPDWDLPSLPEWDDSSWVRWVFDDLGTLPCHPQEVLDNIVDAAHQWPIHGQRIVYFDNEFLDHQVRHREGGVSRTALSAADEILSIDATYHGPGILLSYLGGHYPSYFLIAHTPVEDGSIHVWHSLMMKSSHPVATTADVAAARQFQALSLKSFSQDFDVWLNKRSATHILQLPDDGPYHRLRQWHRQFYNPLARRAEITRGLNGKYAIRGIPRGPE
jgi:3-ketosteroid 9alpha-monooxygenase subunit A